MNRTRFEDAKKEIIKFCCDQDYFNGRALSEYRPSHQYLPEDLADTIAEFGNALLDVKIIAAARELVAAADDVEFVPVSADKFVEDIHFDDDHTAKITYDDGTIGKVERAFNLKRSCEGWLAVNATKLDAGNLSPL